MPDNRRSIPLSVRKASTFFGNFKRKGSRYGSDRLSGNHPGELQEFPGKTDVCVSGSARFLLSERDQQLPFGFGIERIRKIVLVGRPVLGSVRTIGQGAKGWQFKASVYGRQVRVLCRVENANRGQ